MTMRHGHGVSLISVSVGVGTGGDGGQWRQGHAWFLFFASKRNISTLRRCSISCSKLSFEHQIITENMGMNMEEGFPTLVLYVNR